MTGAQVAPGTGPLQERGWRRIIPALVLFLLVPALGPIRLLFPLEQTMLLVAPLIAACALVAWYRGGRAWMAVTWVLLSIWMLSRPAAAPGNYDFLVRGWVVLLSAAFGLVNLVADQRPLLQRALVTIPLALTVASMVVLFSSISPARVQRTLADELDRRQAAISASLRQETSTQEWQDATQNMPRLRGYLDEAERQFGAASNFTQQVFPALLALESLAALALAWGLIHRMSRTRIGPPLAPLRDFRFSDQLVWGLLAGLAIVVIPSLAGLRGLGWNLVLFFGALYALRGFGVLAWFIASRRLALALLVVLTVVVLPFIGVLSLIGLGDTWIDWRGRVRHVS